MLTKQELIERKVIKLEQIVEELETGQYLSGQFEDNTDEWNNTINE